MRVNPRALAASAVTGPTHAASFSTSPDMTDPGSCAQIPSTADGLPKITMSASPTRSSAFSSSLSVL